MSDKINGLITWNFEASGRACCGPTSPPSVPFKVKQVCWLMTTSFVMGAIIKCCPCSPMSPLWIVLERP